MRFDDEVVIVTGAGRGLGREHALGFAARAVVVNDPGIEEGAEHGVAQTIADEIVAEGGRAMADRNSVATRAGVEAIVQAALDAFGKVTVLVNNASIISFAPMPQIRDEDWRASRR